MADLRLQIQSSPEQTKVFVGNAKVHHVQKVTITPDEILVYFPAPSLHPEKREQIERSMELVRTIPGVLIGHIVTDDTRTLGKGQRRRRGSRKSG